MKLAFRLRIHGCYGDGEARRRRGDLRIHSHAGDVEDQRSKYDHELSTVRRPSVFTVRKTRDLLLLISW